MSVTWLVKATKAAGDFLDKFSFNSKVMELVQAEQMKMEAAWDKQQADGHAKWLARHNARMVKQQEAVALVIKLSDATLNLNEKNLDAFNKATLSEYNYAVWAIKEKYRQQAETLTKEKADKESFAKNAKAMEAELTAVSKTESDKRNGVAKELAAKAVELAKAAAEKIKQAARELATALVSANESAMDTIKRATLSEYNYTVWALNEKYKKQKETLKKMGASEKDFVNLDKAQEIELTRVYKTEQDKQAAIAKETADKKAKVAKESFDKIKKAQDELRHKFQECVQGMQELWSIFMGAMQQMSANRYQKEFNAMDTEYEKRKKLIADSLMSETEKNAAYTLLDEEYASKKRALEIKQAQATKASGITQAIVNAALAIVNALCTIPFIPTGLVAAAIAAAAGAAQVAVIKSTPLPGMAQGGLLSQPTPVLAGEAGPEAFLPLPELKEMLGIGKTGSRKQKVINISINAFDGEDVSRVFHKKLLPLIKGAFRREALTVPSMAVR